MSTRTARLYSERMKDKEYGKPTTLKFDPDELWHYCEGTWREGSTGLCSVGRERWEHVLNLTTDRPPRKGPVPDGQSRATMGVAR